MKTIEDFMELVVSLACAITIAIIIVPLHLLIAPLASRKQRCKPKPVNDHE
ncbi:hypothetical protein [Nostoc linckia]|jgi:hypothetical protein|uniref:hypothetical protein n=1 Tax=Nostoc linckia TaxID=92942 RepID=UPI0015D49A2B|nr:hypothetical protein [Nostoc linckia]